MAGGAAGVEPGTRFRVRERVLSRRLEHETVLLDLDSGHYFDLDETGGRIWAALLAEQPAEALVAELASEYDATPERIAADVTGLLGELERAGLVVRSG